MHPSPQLKERTHSATHGKSRTLSTRAAPFTGGLPLRFAVAYSEQLQADRIFATRLWGEPLVLYRDAQGEPVCVRDVCPHRSAPLSMGDVQVWPSAVQPPQDLVAP